MKNRPLCNQQCELRVGLGESSNLLDDELLIAFERWTEIERELAIEDFFRNASHIQNTDRLLCELFDTDLLEF